MNFPFEHNVSLAPYCSMKAGGIAEFLVMPESEEELISAVEYFKSHGKKFMVAGNCSNLLFSDNGYDGAVILTTGIKGISLENGVITAAAGETLSSLARFAMENSLCGFEFCYGIPGTVGGGVYMNAGAYGGEISQRFISGRFLNEKLEIVTLKNEEMLFGYRDSIMNRQRFILLDASFSSDQGESRAIRETMNGLMAKRKASQPLEFPSCGSAFKRPEGHYAGALIEQCGLKGASVGGAQVSEKHAGFIINRENATATDVIRLIRLVSDTVFEKTGVRLEPEIRIID